MTSPPQTTPRAVRPAIIGGALLLAVLAALGTAPSPTAEGTAATVAMTPQPMMTSTTVAEGETMTFADLFAERRTPESGGEGQAIVEVAAPAPPEIPEPGEGTDASGPAPAPVPVAAQVQAVQPVLVVTGVEADAVSTVMAVEGVQAAAAAMVGQVDLAVPIGAQTVTVAAVDPQAFRPLTPPVTANEAGVWDRIIAGDAAFNHDAGNRLTVPLGSELVVGASGEALRIGAYASNGIPPIADALISVERARELGVQGQTAVYVAVDEAASLGDVEAAVRAALPGATIEPIEEPEEQQAFLTGSDAANFFEPFNYIDHGDGLITIDPDWVARNIETRRLPIFTGNVTCHRQMLIQLEGALAEVEASGLAHLIDTTDYGGCWVARHIDWRPDRPISMHGWGLAVDFNVRTNGLGQPPTMDPRIVAIFDRWGFVWGGRWSRPDGMHFELGAVLQTPPTSAIGTVNQ